MKNTTDTQPPKLTHAELAQLEHFLDFSLQHLRQQIEALKEGDEDTFEGISEVDCDVYDDDDNPSFEKAEKVVERYIDEAKRLIERIETLQKYCEHCGARSETVGGLYLAQGPNSDLILCESCADKLDAA